jgi:hypothetical protein
MRDVVLAEWTKSSGNIVQFKLYKHNGYLRLDFREYFAVGDKWKPTRKGVNLPARAASDLSKSAERAVKLIEKQAAKKIRRGRG